MRGRKKGIISILLWISGVTVAIIIILVYLQAYGNRNQIYTDIILGNLSKHGGNKTIEKRLLYALSFIGGGFVVAIELKKNRLDTNKFAFKKGYVYDKRDNMDSKIIKICSFENIFIAGLLLLLPLFNYVLWGRKESTPIIFAIFIGIWAYKCLSELTKLCMAMFISYYAVCGIENFFSLLKINISFNDKAIKMLLVGGSFAITYLATKNKKYLYIVIVGMQLFIPLLLFAIAIPRYQKNEELFVINIPTHTLLMLGTIVCVLIIRAIKLLTKVTGGGVRKTDFYRYMCINTNLSKFDVGWGVSSI